MEITMKLTLNQAAIHLEPGEVLTMRDAVGTTVRVLSGRAWLTQEHDTQDYILEAGESFVIGKRGLTVVNGLSDATFSVLDPDALRRNVSPRIYPHALPAA
jgi:hypothetical protein